VGCFLTGLEDHTYGLATSLPWGVDFGDGIRRHPTQLYDIVFLAVLGLVLCLRFGRRPWGEGRMFRSFMLAYLAWRFAVEFIKPREIRVAGLSAIQLASGLGAAICWTMLARRTREHAVESISPDAGMVESKVA
jgi:prolipoprotein diacylglyceryltransferase